MTAFINGRLYSDAGQLQALNGAAGVPSGAFLYEGWAADSAGSPYVEDLGAGAVPAAAKFPSGTFAGVAFHEDGRMYVTTQAPAAGDAFVGGIAVRQDGAMRVSTVAVNAADALIAGWAIAQTGAARMAIT